MLKFVKNVPIKKMYYSTLSFKKDFEVKDIIVKDGSLFIMPDSATKAEKTIAEIIETAKNAHTTDLTLNLSRLNMFDALKIATLTAAHELANDLKNHVEVIVSNEVVKTQINSMSLPNLNVMVIEPVKKINSPKLLAIEV